MTNIAARQHRYKQNANQNGSPHRLFIYERGWESEGLRRHIAEVSVTLNTNRKFFAAKAARGDNCC